MFRKKKFLLLSIFLSFLFIQPALAYKTIDSSNRQLDRVIEPTGIEKTDIQTTTGNLIQNTLTIVGTLFLALMIYGGFLWMTARGEEDQINKGKNTIIAAMIGLSVIVGAYAITNIALDLFSNTGSQGSVCTDQLRACEDACDQSADRATCSATCGDQYSQCLSR